MQPLGTRSFQIKVHPSLLPSWSWVPPSGLKASFWLFPPLQPECAALVARRNRALAQLFLTLRPWGKKNTRTQKGSLCMDKLVPVFWWLAGLVKSLAVTACHVRVAPFGDFLLNIWPVLSLVRPPPPGPEGSPPPTQQPGLLLLWVPLHFPLFPPNYSWVRRPVLPIFMSKPFPLRPEAAPYPVEGTGPPVVYFAWHFLCPSNTPCFLCNVLLKYVLFSVER